jgi:nucleotide-binding universal stress UspA family protein
MSQNPHGDLMSAYAVTKKEDTMEDVKRILVISRSTKDCKKAVHYGISLAKTYGAQLSILHTMHDPFFLKGGSLPIPLLRGLEDEYRAMVQKVKSDLVMMIKKEKAGGMAIKEIVKDAEPVHEIVKTVEAKKIDLIIMAAHDETRIEHIIYGRINHEIVRRLPCSVFLVKGE